MGTIMPGEGVREETSDTSVRIVKLYMRSPWRRFRKQAFDALGITWLLDLMNITLLSVRVEDVNVRLRLEPCSGRLMATIHETVFIYMPNTGNIHTQWIGHSGQPPIEAYEVRAHRTTSKRSTQRKRGGKRRRQYGQHEIPG